MSEILQHYVPAHRRLAQGTLAFAAVVCIAGCGSNYRPTVTPITPTGPPAQPSATAFVVSTTTATAPGVGTVIDYSGDTVMATAPIGPGPVSFVLNSGGNEAWSLDSDGTVANIPATTSLQAKQVTYSTLNPLSTAANPVVALFSGTLGLYALDVSLNEVDVLTGSPDAFKLTVPVDVSPVTMVGVSGAPRYYAISQMIPYLTPVTIGSQTIDGGVACNVNPHAITTTGMADAVETSPNYTVSAHIPVGVCPDYAVGSPDGKRVYVLNRGSDSISVINSQINTIDQCAPGVNQNGQPFTCHPSIPLTGASGLAHAGPVYAEFNSATDQLVVANYEGNSISIIDVGLDEYGNDGPNFGTTFTVPVGNNPASVTVLADGSRAYVANQSDSTVTIVNMSSHTVEQTLAVTGHPRTVISTQNSLYGKIYVASPDSTFVTIIRTDQDIVSTNVLVQGNAIDVRTSSPDASSTNPNTVSRAPGAGQPCYLPPSALPTATITVANCKVQDPTLLTPSSK
jgi:YVTN family beta-propeller protein